MITFEDTGAGEGERWAGFRAVVCKEEPNPACKLGTPDKGRMFVVEGKEPTNVFESIR